MPRATSGINASNGRVRRPSPQGNQPSPTPLEPRIRKRVSRQRQRRATRQQGPATGARPMLPATTRLHPYLAFNLWDPPRHTCSQPAGP